MDDPFRMLADPTRRRILELTAGTERSVNALVDATGLSQPAVSKQLAVLRRVGLVTVRREGTLRLYRARPDELHAMRAWLDRWAVEMEERLDALEDHLDRM